LDPGINKISIVTNTLRKNIKEVKQIFSYITKGVKNDFKDTLNTEI